MRNTITGKAALAMLALCFTRNAFADGTGYYSGYELSKDAQITMDQASTIVLQMYPRGVITNRSLLRETGGTGLRYSFDVRSQAQMIEVGIDAGNGDVIANQLEIPNSDGR